jgi:hypothetical protein
MSDVTYDDAAKTVLAVARERGWIDRAEADALRSALAAETKLREEAEAKAEAAYQSALDVYRAVGGCRHLRTQDRPDLDHLRMCVPETAWMWHENLRAAETAAQDAATERDALTAALKGTAAWVGPCVHGSDPWDRCDECENGTAIDALLAVLAAAEARATRAEGALRELNDALHWNVDPKRGMIGAWFRYRTPYVRLHAKVARALAGEAQKATAP